MEVERLVGMWGDTYGTRILRAETKSCKIQVQGPSKIEASPQSYQKPTGLYNHSWIPFNILQFFPKMTLLTSPHRWKTRAAYRLSPLCKWHFYLPKSHQFHRKVSTHKKIKPRLVGDDVWNLALKSLLRHICQKWFSRAEERDAWHGRWHLFISSKNSRERN